MSGWHSKQTHHVTGSINGVIISLACLPNPINPCFAIPGHVIIGEHSVKRVEHSAEKADIQACELDNQPLSGKRFGVDEKLWRQRLGDPGQIYRV